MAIDLPWGDERASSFVTNAALITSDGPLGPNIATVAWTYQASYQPGFVVVCFNPADASHENIMATKEFGIHLAASDQNIVVSTAGGSSGRKVDKIKLLTELGCAFVKAKFIKPPMLEGSAMRAECKLLQSLTLGDHTMFVGEVLEATAFPEKKPLIYSHGKYWNFGSQIVRPDVSKMEHIKKLVEKFTR